MPGHVRQPSLADDTLHTLLKCFHVHLPTGVSDKPGGGGEGDGACLPHTPRLLSSGYVPPWCDFIATTTMGLLIFKTVCMHCTRALKVFKVAVDLDSMRKTVGSCVGN